MSTSSMAGSAASSRSFPVGYYATCFAVECEYECIAAQKGDCANRECTNPNPECCEAVQVEIDCES